MIQQEKNFFLLWYCFLYVVYNGEIEKTQIHFVITLFFLCCLWLSKRKTHSLITLFFDIVYDRKEKQFILLQHYFLYVVYDGPENKFILLQYNFFSLVYDGAREKTNSVITLFFVYCLWSSKRKNSFYYNFIFSMLSLIEQEKKLFLLRHYFLDIVYDTAREKTYSVIKFFFLYFLWWSKKKNPWS